MKGAPEIEYSWPDIIINQELELRYDGYNGPLNTQPVVIHIKLPGDGRRWSHLEGRLYVDRGQAYCEIDCCEYSDKRFENPHYSKKKLSEFRKLAKKLDSPNMQKRRSEGNKINKQLMTILLPVLQRSGVVVSGLEDFKIPPSFFKENKKVIKPIKSR